MSALILQILAVSGQSPRPRLVFPKYYASPKRKDHSILARGDFCCCTRGDWYAQVRPMGQWLVDNMPRGANLDINSNRKSRREIPFTVGETE